jgi:pSer/pThr/pTyr-binding forkhead associated (FHA) protein
VGGVPGERATAPHDLHARPLLHAFAFLDHRSRAEALDARTAPPGHYLALSDGERERLVPIAERTTHVGRTATSDLRFDEIHVSRRHAIVVRYGHHVRILDDRSSGGTFVNGHRIIAIDLHDGDVIRLGRLVFRYLRVR